MRPNDAAPASPAMKPGLARSPHTLAFHRGIFEEHLDEAAFLYELHLSRAGNPACGWRELADIEERLELRIDALTVGRGLAQEVCAQRVAAGTPAEVFAALCVSCRLGNAASTAEILQNLDPGDEAQLQAAKRALCLELPAHWHGFVEKTVSQRGDATAALLTAVGAHLRLPLGPALLGVLRAGQPASLPVVEALGRLQVREAKPELERCLSEPGLRAPALLALCRIGAHEALRLSYGAARTEAWPRIAIGLAGDRQGLAALLSVARAGDADASCLHALGLLGDPSALEALCAYLSHPELAEPAAMALQWMTGADLLEEVFVPEPIDEDALTASELHAWRQHGQAPHRPDGRPEGETVHRLSQSPPHWQTWLAKHGPSLNPQWRYRHGQPASPAVLLERLVDARSHLLVRHFASLELSIRYGCRLPFHPEAPVAEQVRNLQALSDWVHVEAGRFIPGQWYFDGWPL